MPRLYVVATPIGNLGDLSERVRAALAEAHLIAAEDTRVAMKLLNHLGLSKPTISCHRHNERGRANELVARMQGEDLTVALTSDAGTPAISDPGHILVDAAWAAGIPVVPIAGPSALATALSAAGFDAVEFGFFGFLPRERGKLREKLAAIRALNLPVAVAHESPHRVVALVDEIAELFPACRLAVCCDLTKKFERIDRGPALDVAAALRAHPNVEKGEYIVAIDFSACPPAPPPAAEVPAAARMLCWMLDGLPLADAADRAAAEGAGRNEIYRAKLQIKDFLNRQNCEGE